jgi:hypothetical protein
MQESTFDILSGTPGKNAKWLESVSGLTNARKRMEGLAAETPGQYFIFNPWNSCVLLQVDTHAKPISAFKEKVASAA